MYRGEVYCPKYTDLKPRPCPKPPTRAILVEEVNKEIHKQFLDRSRCLTTTSQRMPDQRWLLDALSALNPAHLFFTKGFQPDRPNDPYLQFKLQQITGSPFLEYAVFRGLPPSLIVKRKSLKTLAPTGMQPQVSAHILKLIEFKQIYFDALISVDHGLILNICSYLRLYIQPLFILNYPHTYDLIHHNSN